MSVRSAELNCSRPQSFSVLKDIALVWTGTGWMIPDSFGGPTSPKIEYYLPPPPPCQYIIADRVEKW